MSKINLTVYIVQPWTQVMYCIIGRHFNNINMYVYVSIFVIVFLYKQQLLWSYAHDMYMCINVNIIL